MDIRKQLNHFRSSIKEQICHTITDIYKKQNNGILPNFSEWGEVCIDSTDIKKHIKINVEVNNTFDSETIFEQWVIQSYVVTLNFNLYFICEDKEIEWKELSTDDLVGICEQLNIVNNNFTPDNRG